MKAIRLVVLLAVFGLMMGAAQAQVVVTAVQSNADRTVTFTVQNQGERKVNLTPSFGALGAQGTCPHPYLDYCENPYLDLNSIWTAMEPSQVKKLAPLDTQDFTVTITDDDRDGYALVSFNASGSFGMAEIDYDGDGDPFIPPTPKQTIQVQRAEVVGLSVEFDIVNISNKVQAVSTSVSCRYDEFGDGVDAREAAKSKEVWSPEGHTDKRGRLLPGGVQHVRITPDDLGPHWIILRAGSGAGELHSYGYAVRP